jgi:SAM-dependent methyltransferase
MNFIQKLLIKYYMTPKRFSNYLIKAEESKAYGEVAEKSFGINLGQFNLFPKSQLDGLISMVNSSDDALDVGCGNGKITNYISSKTGCRIKGIDFAEDAVRKANEKFGNGKTTFEIQNISHLDDFNGSYSKIISIDTLYFFPDLKPVMKSLIRLLNSDGKIIIFFTHNASLHGNINNDLIEASLIGEEVKVKKTDLTIEEIEMWRIMKRELERLRDEFKKEGCFDLFKARYLEAKSFLKMGEHGKIRRTMYEITR